MQNFSWLLSIVKKQVCRFSIKIVFIINRYRESDIGAIREYKKIDIPF